MPSDDCEMSLPFKSSRLSVALTLLPTSVQFKQETLFDGINQQLEISLLKCIH